MELDDMKLVRFAGVEEQFKALAYGKVDAAIQNLNSSNYIIRKNGFTDLKVIDEFKLGDLGREDLRLGIGRTNHCSTPFCRKDWTPSTTKNGTGLPIAGSASNLTAAMQRKPSS